MMPSRLALLVVLLVGLPTALGARGSEVDAPAPQPYAAIDGVTYYMVAGLVNASALASDPGTGEAVMDFAGCAFVQLRPDFGRGRVSIAGLVDGFTPLRVDFADFAGDTASQGPIATNLTLDAASHPMLGAGQAARGEAAGEATAQMRASEYYDPEKRAILLANFTDPVGGGEELRARLAMAGDGVRDDETGARLEEVSKGDEELHIVLTSPEGAQPQGDSVRFPGPSDVPDGVPATDAEHAESFQFLNTRFGGQATVTFSATSKAPPGLNSVTVVARAPDGSEVGNATVDWSVLAPGAATLEFPADQLGFYDILVTGQILLASYAVDVELAAAPAFQLDFWWEDVVRGGAAQNAFGDCQRDLGLRASVVAGEVDRAKPPSFPFEAVAVGVGAAVIAALLVVKLVQDQVSSDAFRKMKK